MSRLIKQAFVYLGIIVGTFAVVDLAMIVTGTFPPTYNHGDPHVGWLAAIPTGEVHESVCMEFASKREYRYVRNEDAYRTSASHRDLRGPGALFEIAITGDSHTDLCSPNDRTHFGITESLLVQYGIPSITYANGAGRYSPLQAYLAIRPAIIEYSADALILNLYTGNDFYDILRVDDRPHFVREGSDYEIADPVWYQYDPPGVTRHSRVLFALESVMQASGIRGLVLRVRYLWAAARSQGQGVASVVAYINDLRQSTAPEVGYSGAYSAQMLNQQLFFHHFPGSRAESVRRVRALLNQIRREHPDIMLVLSPIPSYQVVEQKPVDYPLLDVIERLPITYRQGIEEEAGLYEEIGRHAISAGWLFVDNLTALRAYDGRRRLFNNFDYHLEPIASEIIGAAQADVIRDYLDTPSRE